MYLKATLSSLLNISCSNHLIELMQTIHYFCLLLKTCLSLISSKSLFLFSLGCKWYFLYFTWTSFLTYKSICVNKMHYLFPNQYHLQSFLFYLPVNFCLSLTEQKSIHEEDPLFFLRGNLSVCSILHVLFCTYNIFN